jgi:hypothetical protein
MTDRCELLGGASANGVMLMNQLLSCCSALPRIPDQCHEAAKRFLVFPYFFRDLRPVCKHKSSRNSRVFGRRRLQTFDPSITWHSGSCCAAEALRIVSFPRNGLFNDPSGRFAFLDSRSILIFMLYTVARLAQHRS